MWKLTRLFSVLLIGVLVALSDPLKESISLNVKVVGRILEEKPPLTPPDRIDDLRKSSYLDLSSDVFEPPKRIERPIIEPPKEGGGCGDPKEKTYYRAGIIYYQRGELSKAESKMLDVISLQNATLIPQAEYILGLIYVDTNRKEDALGLFKSSCSAQHPFRKPACEAYYALYFQLNRVPELYEEVNLWKVVYKIKVEGEVSEPYCEDTVFEEYCSYVQSFARGDLHEEYPQSTEIRMAITLLEKGELKPSKDIFLRYSRPLSRYRSVALYYLGVIAWMEGDKKRAYKYASLLEVLEPKYSKSLHLLLSQEDLIYSKIAYQITGSKKALRNAGVISYNEGNYKVAYAEFTRAGDHLNAALSAIKERDYRRAYSALKKVKNKDKNYYLWLLETLYWLGKDEEMDSTLESIKKKYPDLYKEYKGWLLFKREKWLSAYKFFKDPYHRALALFNAGKYKDVLKELKGRNSYKARLLKAKAAISMGNGALARKFLTPATPQEIYLLGMSYFIEGKYDRAVSHFKKILMDDNFRSKALLRIADSYYNMGRYEKAKSLYKKILGLYPDSQEALDATLALAQIELQNPSPDLKDLLSKFIKKFPNSPMVPDLKYQLAGVLIKEGNKEEALKILKELSQMPEYRPRALVRIAQIEDDPKKKEELLKEAILKGDKQEKKKATEMLMDLYLHNKEFEKLADFLAKGDREDRKRALQIYMNENIEKAIKLFDALYKEDPQDADIPKLAYAMYEKTKGKRYLEIAAGSQDKKLRAKALYKLGFIEKKRDKRKALERFVEIILSAEGVEPYYSKSALNASEILVGMKAKKDACEILKKINKKHLSKRELKRFNILKRKLPKCEVGK